MNQQDRNEVIMLIADAIGRGCGMPSYANAWLNSLPTLSPTDQGEALRELQRLGQEADAADPDAWMLAQTDDFTPCERTVRLCIEALPDTSATSAADLQAESIGIERCREALESLLPKPSRAEELERRIGELLADDPVCNGRVTSTTIEHIAHLVSKEKLA